MNHIRLKNQPSPASQARTGRTIVYADENGALHAVDGSGRDVAIGVPSVIIEFEETAGAGHYDKTAPIPSGWGVRGIKITGVPWDADSALLRAGDSDLATRFINDLSITHNDLDPEPFAYGIDGGRDTYEGVAGGGQGGARLSDTNGDPFWPFYSDGDTFRASLTTTGAGGTTGRLSMAVELEPLPTTILLAVKTPAV